MLSVACFLIEYELSFNLYLIILFCCYDNQFSYESNKKRFAADIHANDIDYKNAAGFVEDSLGCRLDESMK